MIPEQGPLHVQFADIPVFLFGIHAQCDGCAGPSPVCTKSWGAGMDGVAVIGVCGSATGGGNSFHGRASGGGTNDGDLPVHRENKNREERGWKRLADRFMTPL